MPGMHAAMDLVVTPMGLLFAGRRFACSIGRGGIIPAKAKREGDGATPGCFTARTA